MKKGYVDIPEGQIHYRIDGRGEPLLLLHQTPMDSDDYIDIIPILAGSYRVVAWDMPGRGNSDDPPREYEIEDFARSVVSFLDALRIDRTHIAGHHDGAMIAVEVAAAYPERVDKLVLSGCAAWPQRMEQRRAGARQGSSWAQQMTADGQFLTKTWEIYNKVTLPDLSPQQVFKQFIIALRERNRPRYPELVPQYLNHIQQRMSLIKSPTLLMAGSNDFYYLDELESTKSLIPRCQTRVVEGVGQFPGVEKPEEFAQAILDFLKNPEEVTRTN